MQNTLISEAIQDEIQSLGCTATYSAEDNKLRIYASSRLSSELYAIVKANGFVYAPKQELFVAPKWTPTREDLCVKLAGEIEAEEMTLIERAEAKAQRLDNLANKRANQASAFFDAANRISERFAAGQPILIGHHSERRARKDKDRMSNAMDNAVKANNAVQYWNYRAKGVERHANRKANSGVRARRIQTLLAELRDRQRDINTAHLCLKLWQKIEAITDLAKKEEATIYYAGSYKHAPHYRDQDSLYTRLNNKTISVDDAIETCIEFHEYQASSAYTARWISHILNRLAFERGELGELVRFAGELTPVIIQAFAREHGADQPKATATENGFLLVSPVPLPFHLSECESLELSHEAWRDMMQSTGYEVVIKERKASTKQACPLINPTLEQAKALQDFWNAEASKTKHGKPSEMCELTQEYYSNNSGGDYSRLSTISLDSNGKRIWPSRNKGAVAVCRVRICGGSGFSSADRVIVITDKPQKSLPIDLNVLEAKAA